MLALQAIGHDPAVLRGGMGARTRAAAVSRLQFQPGSPPPLVVATGPDVGEGFDCPALDTLFLAAPVRWKGRLVQYVGRILRLTPARKPPRSTTTTTSAPACSLPPWSAALPVTPASASPTPADQTRPWHPPLITAMRG